MQSPLISILIRSSDRPTLERALQSAIQQTYPVVEVVVVAAKGTVHSEIPSEINGRAIRLVQPEIPLGRAAAANVALNSARGELLNFLDDDDELLPDHLALLFSALQSDPAAKLAFSCTEVVDLDGRLVGGIGEPHARIELFEWSKFSIMAALFRRELLDFGVRFDESLAVHEDRDFWVQCAQHSPFRFVEKITCRWHAFLGTSGAGAGTNFDKELLTQASAQFQSKWAETRASFERSPEGLIQRAQVSLKRDAPEVALAHAERAVLALPADVNALNIAAMANHRIGNSVRATELIERAVRILPNHPELLINQRMILHDDRESQFRA